MMKLEEQYQYLVDQTNIVSKTDKRWIITYVNNKFCELSWYSKEELLWKSHNIIRHPENTKEFFKEMWYTIKEKKQPWEWIVKNKKKNGETYILKTVVWPILDDNWEILEYMSIRTDITEIENTKKALEEAYEKLEEKDEQKDQFINIASHELKTPLTVVNSYLSMLLDWEYGELDNHLMDILNTSKKEINHLTHIVDDMLELIQIESNQIVINKVQFDLKDFFHNNFDKYNALAANKWIIFNINYSFWEYNIVQDKEKLKKIIQELLDNALKFNKVWWFININISLNKKNIIIEIKDGWIWIDKKDFDIVFKKFWQVDKKFNRWNSWTWLWIPIIKWLIEKLWWQFLFDSELWKWTTIKLIFNHQEN